MSVGKIVSIPSVDRIGVIVRIIGDVIEVRLLSGSVIVAHKSFFKEYL